MIARPKLVEPRNIFRQVDAGQTEAEVVSIASVPVLPAAKARVMPTRQANADLRSREYLTPAEIEKLIKAAKDGGGACGMPAL